MIHLSLTCYTFLCSFTLNQPTCEVDVKKNAWILPASLMALGTPCWAGQQPRGWSQPGDSSRAVEKQLCTGTAPCMTSPSILERNCTTEHPEMLLAGMHWDLTSPFSHPSFACNIFPSFILFPPFVFFLFSSVPAPSFESLCFFSLFKLPSP